MRPRGSWQHRLPAGVVVAAGTDAGNSGTLHGPSLFREFELMAAAGLTAAQIRASATLNGAKVMGQETLGTIEPGKIADLVVLNSDPLSNINNASAIFAVVRGGRCYEAGTLLKKTPADVVQYQVNAYNVRDIEAFAATYAPDVKIYRDRETVQLSGREALAKHHRQMFAENPDLHCEIRNRITLGKYVVNHERIRRGGQRIKAIVVYEVEGQTIRRVWLIRD